MIARSKPMLMREYDIHRPFLSRHCGFLIVISQNEAMGLHWKMVAKRYARPHAVIKPKPI